MQHHPFTDRNLENEKGELPTRCVQDDRWQIKHISTLKAVFLAFCT